MSQINLDHADKRISISGVDEENERMIVAEVINARNPEEIERRVSSYRDKGSTKVIIVLPCASVYTKAIGQATEAQIKQFANQVFKTLSS